MTTKLTLTLDKRVIERAKRLSKKRKKSLSRIIEDYLSTLTTEDKNSRPSIEITPFVRSLSSKVGIPGDINIKKEYHQHLEEKYK